MKKLVVAVTATGLLAGGAAFAAVAQAASGKDADSASTASTAAPAKTTAAQAASLGETAASYTPPKIKWDECTYDLGGGDTFVVDCGYLSVPLSYGNPTGKKIKIFVTRLKHTSPAADFQGPMILNPGGPGGSGAFMPYYSNFVPGDAPSQYDWVGFDPRGVGDSIPSLSCDPNYAKPPRPSYVPTTAKLENAWLKRSKDYAKKCDKAGGALLDHVKTTDSANDIESLRKALGAEKINYYGFSYGTYLGQVYATKYKSRVNKVVFDGVVDPSRVWYKANLDQDYAFDKSIDEFFTWVAKYDSIYHLGTNEAAVEKAYYAALAKLKAKPTSKLGPSEWNDVFVSAGYYVYDWEAIASAFSAYVINGKAKPATDLYLDANAYGTKGDDNGFAMYLATECTEGTWSRDWYKWRVDSWVTYGRAPFITWNNTWFNAPCTTWGAKAAKPVTIDGSKAPGALLINETLDAATPFSGALKVRSLFPNSVLIEGVGGSTHAGSLSGVACTDDKIAAYLVKGGSLPARVAGNTSDVKCDPVPAPDPTAPALKAASTQSKVRAQLQAGIGPRLTGSPVSFTK
jgi:pimeloyl-ACP methyl ester carboxylesterase